MFYSTKGWSLQNITIQILVFINKTLIHILVMRAFYMSYSPNSGSSGVEVFGVTIPVGQLDLQGCNPEGVIKQNFGHFLFS